MKPASLRLMGMFVTSFQCRPSLGPIPCDGRELSAPNFSRGGKEKTGPCVQVSDCWSGCLRDWLLSCLSWSGDRTWGTLDAWGPLKTRRTWTSGCCSRGLVVQHTEDSTARRTQRRGEHVTHHINLHNI